MVLLKDLIANPSLLPLDNRDGISQIDGCWERDYSGNWEINYSTDSNEDPIAYSGRTGRGQSIF